LSVGERPGRDGSAGRLVSLTIFEKEIRMAYTYEQLSVMTVAQLREIAQGIEHDAVKGFSTMHKEKLLPALCLALGIEAHKHHVAVGINKSQIKLQIRALKKKRDEALAGKDSKTYREALGEIHHLKNKLRRAIK
jgi:DNA-binding IclR family transcriptional regulator